MPRNLKYHSEWSQGCSLGQEDGKMELCSHSATPYGVIRMLEIPKLDEFLGRITLLDMPSGILSRH